MFTLSWLVVVTLAVLWSIGMSDTTSPQGADLVEDVEREENTPPQGFNCNENAKYKKIIKKTDKVLEDHGFPLLSDDHEKALAVATSLKLKRGLFFSVVNSVVASIPFFVAWILGGGGLTPAYWSLLGALVLVSLAVTLFQDKGSNESAAAVLEKRIKSD